MSDCYYCKEPIRGKVREPVIGEPCCRTCYAELFGAKNT